MHDINSITFRLESYLLQLSEIHHRWSAWLDRSERAVATGNDRELEQVGSESDTLMAELSEVIESRQQLLEDARQLGLPAGDLESLARSLPAWQRLRLRSSMKTAKQQLSNLRRLHVATWILVSQRLQFYRDSLSIMMVGTTRQSVYLPTQTLDGGGQLLDASL